MTEQEIIAGNKVIAEYMGVKKITVREQGIEMPNAWDVDGKGFFRNDSLQYHKYWDWLMPVIKEIATRNGNVIPWSIGGPLMSTLGISSVYDGVIEAIKHENNK